MKKGTLKKIGIILTAVSGTILSVATAGIALPAVLVTIASVAGAAGTSMIVLEEKLK